MLLVDVNINDIADEKITLLLSDHRIMKITANYVPFEVCLKSISVTDYNVHD